MKSHKVILFIICVVLMRTGYTQHNAHWVFPYGFHFNFSKGSVIIDTNFNTLGVEKKILNEYYNYTYSNKQGNMLFYAHSIDTLYNGNHVIICNTDSLQRARDNENHLSFIIPDKNDTDFKLILCEYIEINGQTEVVTYLNQYNFKWNNGKYQCLNEKNPQILHQMQYPKSVGGAPFRSFNHFALSPDSILFITNNNSYLYLFLYLNSGLTLLDSVPFGINETLKTIGCYPYLSNAGDKIVLVLQNDITKNTYLLEGTIDNLKFTPLKQRFKNLVFPFSNQKITWYREICFNYNDSFYYLIPDRCKYQNPNCTYYIFKLNFNDTASQLKEVIPFPANTRVEFMRLSYDNKYYLFTSDYRRITRLMSLSGNDLIELMNRQYDSALLANNNHILFPSLNFITEPYLLLDYIQKTDCRKVSFYNKSNKRFQNHKLYIEALQDTFDFIDSISIYLPRYITKTYYKISGYSVTGAIKWMEDTIRMKSVIAKFKVHSDTICRFNAVTFNDSSFSDTVSTLGYNYTYDFGDGTTKVFKNVKSKISSVSHTYTMSGIYFPRLIFDNGICLDTFYYPSSIVVLPAATPGFKVNNHIGCIPFSLKISDTLTQSIVKKEYDFGNGFTTINSGKFLDTTLVIVIPGMYILKQRITNLSGCITTFSDTIEIKNGLTKNDTVEVYYTTVIDKTTTKTLWRLLPFALKYSINSIETTDTFYIDYATNPNEQSIKYLVKAIDLCGNTSANSHVAQTIFLKGENTNLNQYAILQYTPYETWTNGVLEYQVEYKDPLTNSWVNLNNLPGNILSSKEKVIPDSNGFNVSTSKVCYRIIAMEKAGNIQLSVSNEACVPIYPTVFIPNAFSPNGDGLNEYYKPICVGLNAYIFEIYNRWGELMYSDTPESKGWDGTFRGEKAAEGTYVFRLSAAGFLKSPDTNDARLVERKGTLFLIR